MTKKDFEKDGSVEEFFYWINERQNIYYTRQAGKPWPWTNDPILRDYFFTNVYREQDKVTIWVAENIRDGRKPDGRMIWNLAFARFFNWIPTLDAIGWTANWPNRRYGITQELFNRRDEGYKIFNDAYIVGGSDLKGKDKITGIATRLDKIWEYKDSIYKHILEDATLMKAWWWLQEIPYSGIGPFIAYEITTDLRHTKLLCSAEDIYTWANPGPGAVRGLQRIYGKDAVRGREAAIAYMRHLLSVRKEHTKLSLEMRDIEHSLCEYDKYKRIKLGQGVVRKYRHANA